MDTAYKCRQELISKIKEILLDKLDLANNIIDEVIPQFVEDPEAIWLIKYRNSEWLIMYPTTESKGRDFSLEFRVVGCNSGPYEDRTELGLIFSLEELHYGSFRHVPKEELPTYLSWPYLSEKVNEILKG